MPFTAEQRAKGLATRMANKEARDLAKRGNGLRTSVAVEDVSEPEIHPAIIIDSKFPITSPSVSLDWESAPLPEILARLADMKREYDRVAQIVLRRQTRNSPRWTCWTQLNKDKVPKTVTAQCRKSGDDGRWAFRDDGVFATKDGIRVPTPVFCCNHVCTEYFLKSKSMASLSRH
jgi:hypothetical protein